MNKGFQIAIARILDPVVLRHVPLDDDRNWPPRPPKPEPEVLALQAYHQGVIDRHFIATTVQREALMDLELQVLLTIAESHAVSRRARAVQPFMNWKP